MTTLSASTSQQTLIASNSSRKGLNVFNQGPSTLYVSSVNGFTKANSPVVVQPQKRWTLTVAYTGILYCVSDAATGKIQVTEV